MASGAEITAPVLYRDPLDGAATDGAGFASFMSNLEIEVGCAQSAVRTDVGIHAGTFALDARPEDIADAITQSSHFFA